MRPTEILSGEHRIIEMVLGVLDQMAQDAFDRGHFDVESARRAVDFLVNFADRCHHGKEEARLFPAMESAGLAAHQGPTAVMRHEHELGRAEVRRMAAAIEEFVAGRGGAADAFAFAARTFTDLLREHIAKEDQVLFPMADRMLSGAAQDRLMAEFARVEQDDLGAHDRYLAVAEALAKQYGVASVLAPGHATPDGGGCHGGGGGHG